MSDFVFAANLADFQPGKALAVEVDGVDLALVKDGADVYAIADECSHAMVPLSEGDVVGCEIECYLHGSRFDMRTGKPLGPPAVEPVNIYPTRVEDGIVLVSLKPIMEN